MAAINKSKGKIISAAIPGIPKSEVKVVIVNNAATSTPTQAIPKIANAPTLRQHATPLKKILLIGLAPCHRTSAGACQNINERGR